MAYRKRRRRARNNAPADDAVEAKPETKTTDEPDADDRVPAGQNDLPPESADTD